MTWVGPGLTDTVAGDIAHGLIAPYLDLSDLAAAAEALEPGMPTPMMIGKDPDDADVTPVRLPPLPGETRALLERFWQEHPDLRDECLDKYGHDPVDDPEGYWPYGLAEPEHGDVLAEVLDGGAFTPALAQRWMREELAHVEKATGTLYLIRHGKTPLNDRNPIRDRIRGWQNPPLDRTGIDQAKRLAGWLEGRGVTELYTSDLGRAKQTAEIIGRGLGLKPKVSKAFRPWGLGDFEGQPSAKVQPQLRRYVVDHPDEPVTGGESFNDLVARFTPAFDRLLDRVRGGATVALVTHYRDIKLADGWLKGARRKVVSSVFLANDLEPGSVIAVTAKPGGGWGWRETVSEGKVEKATAQATAAGIAVRAADTGRVLMIQRDLSDGTDRAAGTWEFPGGKLDNGEHPYLGARREWQEETGVRLPRGRHVGEWRSGVYHGFVHEVPSEASVKLNLDHEDRRVGNPDDPDGDAIETMAWHHPEHLRYMRALRDELRRSKVWTKVEKGTAHRGEARLVVTGVHRHPSGMRVYRMSTGDGGYVGRTNPTRFRARKGAVLKVQFADILQDTQGDLRWMNADIAARIDDTPHTWRQLEAMAGATVVKDTAPGPAGDLPPAGDTGVDANPPSRLTLGVLEATANAGAGPTSRQVHVNVPLPNISQAYVQGKGRKGKAVVAQILPITKEGAMKQLVYGVVLEPNALDSQDDFMLPHHVEQAAHGYLKKAIRGKAKVAKLQHRAQGFFREKPSICPVESFIAPVDFSYDGVETIKKGSWVMCMHVEDPALWQRFLDGEFQAFSIGGSGVRQSLHSPFDLNEHDLIGTQQPNYFEPDPQRLLAPFG